MKLYELQHELLLKLREIDPDDVREGNLPPEIIEEIDLLAWQRDKKIDAIAAIMRELELEAAALREEEKRLAGLRHRAEKRRESLFEYLSFCLLPLEKPLTTEHFRFSSRKSQALKIDDEAAIPEQYKIVTVEPNTKLIKEDLKCGADIPGARLEDRTNLQIK